MITSKVNQLRKEANHGDFYFADFLLPSGRKRKSPVFIVSNDNDPSDIIICACTSKPARTNFDIEVQLKKITQVRTNKLYTINRSQLLFPIKTNINKNQYNNIINSIKSALKLK